MSYLHTIFHIAEIADCFGGEWLPADYQPTKAQLLTQRLATEFGSHRQEVGIIMVANMHLHFVYFAPPVDLGIEFKLIICLLVK